MNKTVKLYITQEVINKIKNTIGKLPAETGGILGINQRGVITEYMFDSNSKSLPSKYYPSVDFLNSYMNDNWTDNGILFCGMVHSHPIQFPFLSFGDLNAAKLLLNSFKDFRCIYLFLVLVAQNFCSIDFYRATLNSNMDIVCVKLHKSELKIIK